MVYNSSRGVWSLDLVARGVPRLASFLPPNQVYSKLHSSTVERRGRAKACPFRAHV